MFTVMSGMLLQLLLTLLELPYSILALEIALEGMEAERGPVGLGRPSFLAKYPSRDILVAS